MEHIKNLINGMLIGISSIIPGMSGGTMSVILDIFDEMIGAISSLRRNFKKSVIYLAPIGIGMVLGVLLLSGFLSGMLQSHPVEMQLFFIGGSLREVFRWWTHKALEEPFRRHSLLALIATLAVMLCIFFIRPDDSGAEIIRNPSVSQMIQLLLYAAFAAAAMVIPGVSGSFFLMLFGVYHSVLTAVSEWNFAVLIPVGIGMMIGILFCAKDFGPAAAAAQTGDVLRYPRCVSEVFRISGPASQFRAWIFCGSARMSCRCGAFAVLHVGFFCAAACAGINRKKIEIKTGGCPKTPLQMGRFMLY